MVKAIDRERGLGVAKREKAVNHFFIAGFLMILIGWWRQSRWEEKMLSRLAENPDEKN